MHATVDLEPVARRLELPSRGGAMALLDFGPAERPVDAVFTHANGFNGRTYRTILAPLARRWRILAPDLRGHGASTLPAVIEGRQGWGEFADDLIALVEAQARGPVVLAGHSMGGTASLLAAAGRTDLARALVLYDPVMFPQSTGPEHPAMRGSPLVEGALRRRADFPDRAAAFAAYKGRGAFRTWGDDQLADYVEAGFRDVPGGVTLACRPEWEASNFRTHNYDPFEALQATRAPVRILKAEHHSTCRLETSPDPARVRLETIRGTSHFLPLERPDLVREVLEAALEG